MMKRPLVRNILLSGALICWVVLLNTGIFTGDVLLTAAVIGLLPAILLMYYFFFDIDIFFCALVFCIPLSVKADFPGGFAVSVPVEVMAVMLLFRMLADPSVARAPDRRVFRHPVFIILMIYLGWLMISAITSEIPAVSFKRVFILLLYIAVFFYLFSIRFTTPARIAGFYLVFATGMVIPMINEAIRHSQYHFSPQASYYMPQPFFIEHTLYGAVLAFIIPAAGYLIAEGITRKINRIRQAALIMLFIACLAAEFLSFSRAAWLSLAILPIFMIIFHLRIRLTYLLICFGVMNLVIILNLDPITRLVSRNESRSNRGSIRDQVESVSNIQTDISNLERINRWKCALRMFADRPFTGFGPGTYQFVYYRYQLRKDMTHISTVHGEKGNAHSEYLGHLAETGFPGAIIFLISILIVIRTALRIIYRSKDPVTSRLATMVILCLLTFYVHAIFNAFLDTDEMGSLYYVSLGAILALDLNFYRNEEVAAT